MKNVKTKYLSLWDATIVTMQLDSLYKINAAYI